MLEKATLPFYETERLILREVNPRIQKLIFNEFTHQQLADFFCTGNTLELLDHRYRYEVVMVHNDRLSFRYWLMIDKATGTNIGDVGFHQWIIPHRRAELGYGIQKEEFMQQGLMSEALEKVIAIGFNEMNLIRIEAFVTPGNQPSLAIMRKFGFSGEGYLSRRYIEKGISRDLQAFGLLQTEYRQPDGHPFSLINAFECLSLPLSDWTHEAHLSVGLWYLYHHSRAEALCKLRSGIIAYNNATGVPNNTTRGYHETLTVFWVEILDQFLQKFGKKHPFDYTLQTFLDSPYASKNLPFKYYSRKYLFSVEARSRWVEPDLRGLNE